MSAAAIDERVPSAQERAQKAMMKFKARFDQVQSREVYIKCMEVSEDKL